MMQHATADELRRLRARELAPAEILRLTRHLAACAPCSRRAAETVDARRAAQSLVGGLSPPGTRHDRRVYIAAAAAAAGIAIVAALATSRDRSVTPAPAKTHAIAQKVTAPVPPPTPQVRRGYGNAHWDALVEAARRTGRLPIAGIADLGGTVDVYRGDSGGAREARLTPAGETVESTRPRFAWPPGTPSIVSVYRDGREVLRSGKVRHGTWTAGRDLRRGTVYVWQVELEDGTILPALPHPPAMFRVATAEAARELADARRLFAGDPLLLAVLYARHGIVSRAAEELQRVPGDPDAVRLLESLGRR